MGQGKKGLAFPRLLDLTGTMEEGRYKLDQDDSMGNRKRCRVGPDG